MNVDYSQTPLKSEVVRSILEQQQQGLHEGLDGMENPRIMCPTFTTMLIRTIRALCEVNIKFDNKLEISGSLHIRSDGEKVITCLIEEESERPSFARQNSQGLAKGGKEKDDLSAENEDPTVAMQRLPAVSTLLPGSGRGQLSPSAVPKEGMPPEVSKALAMGLPPLPPGLALLANNALLPEGYTISNKDHRPELANNVAASVGMEVSQAQAAALVAHSKAEAAAFVEAQQQQQQQQQNSHSPMVPMMMDKAVVPIVPVPAPPDERALNLSHTVPQDSSPQPTSARRESLKSPTSPRPSPPTSGSATKVKNEPGPEVLSLPPVSGALPTSFPLEMLSPNIGVGPAVEVAGSSRKKFQCMFCGCFLSTKCYLKNHINAMHTKARAYPCELCEKYFYSAGALRIHKLRNHWQGSKKHKCEHCGEQFLLPIELRRHISKKHGIDESSLSEMDISEPITPTTPITPGTPSTEVKALPLQVPLAPGVQVEQQPSEEVPENVLADGAAASAEANAAAAALNPPEQRRLDFVIPAQDPTVPEPEDGPPDVQETVEIPDQWNRME